MAAVAWTEGFHRITRKPARRFAHLGVPGQWRKTDLPALHIDKEKSLQFVAKESSILLCVGNARKGNDRNKKRQKDKQGSQVLYPYDIDGGQTTCTISEYAA